MMKKRRTSHSRQVHDEPIPWLPIDSRLFPFIKFGHVKGVARVFLQIEIVLAICIVIGTLIIAAMKVMG
jgi:hypothetical protein